LSTVKRLLEVDGSLFHAVGYDAYMSLLAIRLRRKAHILYQFHHVPAHVFAEFISADSMEDYFNAYIVHRYHMERDG
jgi:hypothetical protein